MIHSLTPIPGDEPCLQHQDDVEKFSLRSCGHIYIIRLSLYRVKVSL